MPSQTDTLISADTEWTAGSDHDLTGTIIVAAGVTLKIDAGAQVSGGSIKVLGNLIASGTSASPITFTNVDVNYQAGAQNARISLDHTKISGGQLLDPTGDTVYGALSLTNSYLNNVNNYSFMYVWYPNSTVTISNNYLYRTGSISIGSSSQNVNITGNTFLDISIIYPGYSSSEGAIITNWAAYGTAQTNVSGNNFLDTGRMTLQLPDGFNSTNINSVSNYFGTNRSDVAAAMVHDSSSYGTGASAISTAMNVYTPNIGTPGFDNLPANATARVIPSQIDGASDFLLGRSSQYAVSVTSGQWSLTDMVPGRDGSQNLSQQTSLLFADGIGVADQTGAVSETIRFYTALHRAPDLPGLHAWSSAVDNGLSANAFALAFAQSPEYQAIYDGLNNADFIQKLYENVLDRTGSSVEINGWTNALAEGLSRTDALSAIVQSSEARILNFGTGSDPIDAALFRLYETAFGRTPDISGLAAWHDAMSNGMSLQEVAKHFVASDEFKASFQGVTSTQYIDTLYRNALHRSPDAVGEQGWVQGLDNGLTQAQALVGFSQSSEAQIVSGGSIKSGWALVTS